MSRTTRRTCTPEFKMRAAREVAKGDRTLGQVAADNGAAPSPARERRDQPLGGAGDAFGKAQSERERRAGEEAAQGRCDEAVRKAGRLTLERGFLRRSCDGNGLPPSEGRGRGRGAAGGRREEGGACEPLRAPEAPWGEAGEERARALDDARLARPGYGARKPAHVPACGFGPPTGRWKARGLTIGTGLGRTSPRPSPSGGAKGSKVSPCPLGPVETGAPDAAWPVDAACAQTGRGHMCPTCVTDWLGRRAAGWRPSGAMRARGPTRCVREAIGRHGAPAIANSGQGPVLGPEESTAVCRESGVGQSMDGRARWVDNVRARRWSRTLESECPRDSEHTAPREPEDVIGRFVDHCNGERVHRALGHDIPDDRCFGRAARAA